MLSAAAIQRGCAPEGANISEQRPLLTRESSRLRDTLEAAFRLVRLCYCRCCSHRLNRDIGSGSRSDASHRVSLRTRILPSLGGSGLSRGPSPILRQNSISLVGMQTLQWDLPTSLCLVKVACPPRDTLKTSLASPVEMPLSLLVWGVKVSFEILCTHVGHGCKGSTTCSRIAYGACAPSALMQPLVLECPSLATMFMRVKR